MVCKNCGKELPDDAKFCPRCGKLTSYKAQKKKWYERNWIWVIVAILVFAIFGGRTDGDDPVTDVPEAESETKVVVELSEKEQFAADFCEESGLSEDCANSLYDFLFADLAAQNIRFVGKNPVGDINWDVSTTGYRLMVTADEGGIYRVICGDYTLYDGESIKYTCDDLAQRDVSKDRAAYVVIAQEIVSGVLKAPSTAEFQNSWDMAVARNGNLVAVQGYVDSQNGFGAMIRSDFVVEFNVIDIGSFSYETQYIRIGDEESGEFIDLE